MGRGVGGEVREALVELGGERGVEELVRRLVLAWPFIKHTLQRRAANSDGPSRTVILVLGGDAVVGQVRVPVGEVGRIVRDGRGAQHTCHVRERER